MIARHSRGFRQRVRYARHACASLPMLRDPVSGHRLVSSRHRINPNAPRQQKCASTYGRSNTMTAERIGHWTKMRQSLALFNGLESSVHARYLANLTTTMSKCRLSVHTACGRHLASHRDTAQALNARGMRQLCSQRRICFSVRPSCSKSPTTSSRCRPPMPRASYRRSSRPRQCGRWGHAPACRRDSRCP